MAFSFRNLVCAVPSFVAGNRGFEHLGFRVELGGHHTIGTRNALVHTDNGYAELLSVADPEGARASPRRRAILEHIERDGAGLIGFALHTDALQDDIERLEDQGLCYGGPVPAARKLDDGRVFRWQVLRPVPQPCPAVLPVLISGADPEPASRANPNTVDRIAGISVVTDDGAALVTQYSTLLRTEPDQTYAREDLGATAEAFALGGFVIEILEPTRAGVASRALSRTGPGPVEAHLCARDVGACAELIGLSVEGNELVVPPILGMGIRMRITEAPERSH